MVLGKAGAAIVIEQKNLTADRLKEVIADLCAHPEKRIAMGQRAGALFAQDTDERIWEILSGILS